MRGLILVCLWALWAAVPVLGAEPAPQPGGASPNAPERPRSVAREHSDWVSKVLKEIRTIKPGMTRQDLLKVFPIDRATTVTAPRAVARQEIQALMASLVITEPQFSFVTERGTPGTVYQAWTHPQSRCIQVYVALNGDRIEALTPPFLRLPDGQAPKEAAGSHGEWLAKVLQEIGTVKPGVTRQDLSRMFTTEGGLSTPATRTYVHRECRYIKVQVSFRSVGPGGGGLGDEPPQDVIALVSRPYLQSMIGD